MLGSSWLVGALATGAASLALRRHWLHLLSNWINQLANLSATFDLSVKYNCRYQHANLVYLIAFSDRIIQ